MLKAIYDRLAYALIGFFFGAVFAIVLWILYDKGFSRQPGHPEVHAGVLAWIKYVGGAFAIIGFLFKDRVGSAIGSSSSEVYNYEAGKYDPPTWFVVLLLVAIAVAVWHFSK
jgi:hypothetical protein